MLKAKTRKMIVLKNTNSAVFDEAYLILRDGEEYRCCEDIVDEANRLIASRTFELQEHKKAGRLRDIAIGFIAGACLAFIICLIIM